MRSISQVSIQLAAQQHLSSEHAAHSKASLAVLSLAAFVADMLSRTVAAVACRATCVCCSISLCESADFAGLAGVPFIFSVTVCENGVCV